MISSGNEEGVIKADSGSLEQASQMEQVLPWAVEWVAAPLVDRKGKTVSTAFP